MSKAGLTAYDACKFKETDQQSSLSCFVSNFILQHPAFILESIEIFDTDAPNDSDMSWSLNLNEKRPIWP